jgi:glutamyl-Q tRNA(Asp) synthetase
LNDSPAVADSNVYRGRFAPSPTGPLHAGSLVAALASFLDARHHNGQWQLRIDDIDPPRAVAGSIDAITEALLAHGLEWDGPSLYQSHSSSHYDSALERLMSSGWLFRCLCTRTTLDADGCCGQRCQDHNIDLETPHSLRVKVAPERLEGFSDRFLGEQPAPTETALKDFIVKRRDGLYAYQLAAAIDDAKPQFTHVVRGSDLLASTHRQRWLQQLLGLEPPSYAHVAVLVDQEGNKLSKQTGAPPLDNHQPEKSLRQCLQHLAQPAPPSSARRVPEILDHATEHWCMRR